MMHISNEKFEIQKIQLQPEKVRTPEFASGPAFEQPQFLQPAGNNPAPAPDQLWGPMSPGFPGQAFGLENPYVAGINGASQLSTNTAYRPDSVDQSVIMTPAKLPLPAPLSQAVSQAANEKLEETIVVHARVPKEGKEGETPTFQLRFHAGQTLEQTSLQFLQRRLEKHGGLWESEADKMSFFEQNLGEVVRCAAEHAASQPHPGPYVLVWEPDD